MAMAMAGGGPGLVASSPLGSTEPMDDCVVGLGDECGEQVLDLVADGELVRAPVAADE